ncbi:MAG TPA: D-alanine--D-alanine ligase [Syntrophorhabdales bacterium]|nr:D-alanine--D-alanine ligase [Syntrophorhabdales bacterium]
MNRQELKGKKIGVLMGGLSSEREISLRSGNAILESLVRSGYGAIAVDVDRDIAKRLRQEAIEVAFIALHGRWGEDGTIQGLLEILGIPYTGSGVLGSSVSMDKAIMKLLLKSLGVATPEYVVCRSPEEAHFPLPLVVKPAREGSTIGISIVREEKEKKDALTSAFRFDSKLLLERYIAGREITIGIVNGTALPVVEVRPASGFYDFTAKYTKGMTEYLVPAKLDERVEREAYDQALRIWNSWELAGCVRIDMLLDGETPSVIDVNTSPGMTESSLVPKAWAHLGRSFDELVEEILMKAGLKA